VDGVQACFDLVIPRIETLSKIVIPSITTLALSRDTDPVGVEAGSRAPRSGVHPRPLRPLPSLSSLSRERRGERDLLFLRRGRNVSSPTNSISPKPFYDLSSRAKRGTARVPQCEHLRPRSHGHAILILGTSWCSEGEQVAHFVRNDKSESSMRRPRGLGPKGSQHEGCVVR
jgi:hypothetical protein